MTRHFDGTKNLKLPLLTRPCRLLSQNMQKLTNLVVHFCIFCDCAKKKIVQTENALWSALTKKKTKTGSDCSKPKKQKIILQSDRLIKKCCLYSPKKKTSILLKVTYKKGYILIACPSTIFIDWVTSSAFAIIVYML